MQKWSMRLIRFIYSILNLYDGFVWGKVEMEMEKKCSSPKNESSVIIYSPSWC